MPGGFSRSHWRNAKRGKKRGISPLRALGSARAGVGLSFEYSGLVDLEWPGGRDEVAEFQTTDPSAVLEVEAPGGNLEWEELDPEFRWAEDE